MARITEVTNGNPVNGHGRNSPSEVFSTNILQMEKKKEKKSTLFKKLAIFAAILCVLFMLATIALAIMLGMKMRSFQTLEEEDTPKVVGIPSPLLEVRKWI
jgi:type IV secretory pathway component VirB8